MLIHQSVSLTSITKHQKNVLVLNHLNSNGILVMSLRDNHKPLYLINEILLLMP